MTYRDNDRELGGYSGWIAWPDMPGREYVQDITFLLGAIGIGLSMISLLTGEMDWDQMLGIDIPD